MLLALACVAYALLALACVAYGLLPVGFWPLQNGPFGTFGPSLEPQAPVLSPPRLRLGAIRDEQWTNRPIGGAKSWEIILLFYF